MDDQLFLPRKNKTFQLFEQRKDSGISDVIKKILVAKKEHTLGGESIQALKEEGRC